MPSSSGLSQTFAITRKDLRVIFRDKSALVFIFGMPLMFLLLFGSIFRGRDSGSGGRPAMKVLVANADQGKHGAEFVESMRKVGLTVEASSGGASDVRARVSSGDRALGVIVPADFSATLEAAVASGAGGDNGKSGEPAKQATLEALTDPAQADMAGMAQGLVFAAMQRTAGPLYRAAALARVPEDYRSYAAQMMGGGAGSDGPTRQPIALKVTNLSGEKSEQDKHTTAGNVMVPGYAVLFVFFLANSVAISLITERQEGTLRRMLSAPISRNQILFGKLLARGFLGILQIAMLFAVGRAWLHFELGSSIPGLILTALSTIFAATGLGLLIATFGKTSEQIAGMTSLALFAMGGISGCMMPRMMLPEFMQKISLVTPHAWALTAYQDLILRRLPLAAALPSIAVVVLFGAAFYGVALARFRYE